MGDDHSLHDLTNYLLSLFPERTGSWLKYKANSEWNALSQFHQVSDENFLNSINGSSNTLRAVRLGVLTQVLVVRTQPDQVAETAKALKKLNLNFARVTSSDVTHHIEFYIYLTRPARTEVLAGRINGWFRKQKLSTVQALSIDEPVALPLQHNFEWFNLDLKSIARRSNLDTRAAIMLFLSDLSKTQTDPDELLNQLDQPESIDNSQTEPSVVDQAIVIETNLPEENSSENPHHQAPCAPDEPARVLSSLELADSLFEILSAQQPSIDYADHVDEAIYNTIVPIVPQASDSTDVQSEIVDQVDQAHDKSIVSPTSFDSADSSDEGLLNFEPPIVQSEPKAQLETLSDEPASTVDESTVSSVSAGQKKRAVKTSKKRTQDQNPKPVQLSFLFPDSDPSTLPRGHPP